MKNWIIKLLGGYTTAEYRKSRQELLQETRECTEYLGQLTTLLSGKPVEMKGAKIVPQLRDPKTGRFLPCK